ncbi:hypothetical protein CYLTODRAFT_427427 [Cylindrobasidium torrendii FP15055 ss-10]|uniref:MYND-type domain-containing protein n=1 Tax=Cylindrobasidium torrendii FP15055 ss-10 TaxID=1314674 RepID=A0A0D7ATV9_9AGAR|nr:hypothetical protein CYLTODRAFT_427427 [Cylindrobasidium torrendii FP15055 ss-10]
MSQPGRGSDLSDRRTFPTFDALADYGMFPSASDYWKTGPYGNPVPNQHWCFLGEIEENATFIRLAVTVRDRNGRGKIFVACHDDDRGMHLEKLAKKGNTVAVLYPKAHCFADGQVGFRVEDSSQLTILPFSLKELEDASNLFHHPTTNCSAQGCEKAGDLRCTGCRLARYCSAEHQKMHWGQHKSLCKATKAIEWFARKDWTKWDGKPFVFYSPSKKHDPVSFGDVLDMKGIPYGAARSI